MAQEFTIKSQDIEDKIKPAIVGGKVFKERIEKNSNVRRGKKTLEKNLRYKIPHFNELDMAGSTPRNNRPSCFISRENIRFEIDNRPKKPQNQ